MSLSVFYSFISNCCCPCRSFKPTLCRLSPFQLPYVAVSVQGHVASLLACVQTSPLLQKKNREKRQFFLREGGRLYTGYFIASRRVKEVASCFSSLIVLGWKINYCHLWVQAFRKQRGCVGSRLIPAV